MFEDLDPTKRHLACAGRRLLLDRPRIMGIVNVTPDSFSDGGDHFSTDAAIAHGLALAEQGADILDVGGESTRPGAADVPVDEEFRRVIPVIEALVRDSDRIVSVDTSKPEVMLAAIAAGAGMVNDVRALRTEGALDAVAGTGAAICLMHMQGEPRGMQDDPHYDDLIGEIHRFLAERVFACEMAGIERKRIVIDPGFGFGKTLEHNLDLLAGLDRFANLDLPILAGLSRKRMIATLTGRDDPPDRVHGSVAAAVLAAQSGAAIVRVHDVAATRDALAVQHAVALAADKLPKKRDASPATPTIRWPDDD